MKLFKGKPLILFLSALLVLASLRQGDRAPSVSERMAVAGDGRTFIKWVDFNPTTAALNDTLAYDVGSYGTDHHVSWIQLLALLAARSGGTFDGYQSKMLTDLTRRLEEDPSLAPSDLTTNPGLYAYYLEAYDAVLGGMVGEFRETAQGEEPAADAPAYYGLRAFSPLAAGYGYTDYDDFGQSRSYGYKRSHLGHDLLGATGTPVIAIESGYVERLGWNQYGGWRIGIRSLDGKRYYYYAHLRSGHPYHGLEEGQYVDAGSVIGYLGSTGYSRKEDVNGISVPHLHVGLQLIFDASQIDGNNQIWIDLYALTAFLSQNRAVTRSTDGERNAETVCRYAEMPD